MRTASSRRQRPNPKKSRIEVLIYMPCGGPQYRVDVVYCESRDCGSLIEHREFETLATAKRWARQQADFWGCGVECLVGVHAAG